ncbi:hypothetical protein AB0E67_34560 [Streptomyces sp. NPDC032161]|uniref:hypothetical protein n=1 Tax=unclassified Streptomyces TaxID=2593676 RepID=UPI0033F76843
MTLASDLSGGPMPAVWSGVPEARIAPVVAEPIDTAVATLARHRAEQAATCTPECRPERDSELWSAQRWHRFRILT